MDGIIPLGCGLRRKGLGKSYGREHRSKTKKKKLKTNKLQKEHKNGKKHEKVNNSTLGKMESNISTNTIQDNNDATNRLRLETAVTVGTDIVDSKVIGGGVHNTEPWQIWKWYRNAFHVTARQRLVILIDFVGKGKGYFKWFQIL